MRRAKKTPGCFSISPRVPVISPHLRYYHTNSIDKPLDDAGKAKRSVIACRSSSFFSFLKNEFIINLNKSKV